MSVFYKFGHTSVKGIGLSPDTDITPVIAHSFKSNFVMEDSKNNALLHMVTWDMQNRLKAIPLISQKIKDKNNILWDKYLEGKDFLPTETGVLAIYGPLTTTDWGQGTPWNDYCPIDPNIGGRSLVGCVATSMAQIINYFQYPSAVTFTADDNYTSEMDPDDGNGTRIIDITATMANFSNMTYPISSDSGKAALSYACGVASKMGYSSAGSGAYHWNSAGAFKKFGYYSADYKFSSVPDFYSTLQINIKNGQPAQLTISKEGVSDYHSIVCEGYRTDTSQYYLSFGWANGTYGWYTLPVGMPVGYNTVEDAVLNINPHGDGATKLKGLKAYPNPVYFKSSSWLTIVGIPADATEPKVYIYNVAGELVKIVKEILDIPGILPGNTAYWDGTNGSGEKVASGLYIYLVKTGNYGKGSGKFYVFW
ncbi:MAG: C10 family peptidase [Elusimicrobia bacterium]|nr:C10 family peptidase [Elusimicrobiota bacterium]